MANILQIAGTDKSLSLLTEGLKAANLEETLNGAGPFTILAPVNLAFRSLTGADSLENMLKQRKNDLRLTEILSFHIIPGKKMFRDFRNGQKLKTVQGGELEVVVRDGEVRVNGAKILAKDRQGSNGVVHSVDAVNLPAK